MITGFAVAACAAWLWVAMAGGVTVGSLDLTPLAAAVGCGATALAATMRVRTEGSDVFLAPILLVVMPAAAALAAGGHTALPLLACCVIALVSVLPRWRVAGWSLAASEVGVGLVTAGLVLGRNDLHPGLLTPEGDVAAALLAAGAAALALAAGLAPDEEDALRFLVVPALVIGWVVAPLVDGIVPVAAGLTALCCALPVIRRRPTPLVFAAVALAGIGSARPAAALLAAGALLLTALGPVVAWPVALPGAVATALALAAGPGRTEDVVAGAAVAVALIALATTIRGRAHLRPRLVPATALALWLSVVPVTWAWAGDTRLGDYQQGAVRAIAAGLLVTVVAWMTGQLRPPAPEWQNDGW